MVITVISITRAIVAVALFAVRISNQIEAGRAVAADHQSFVFFR